MGDIQRRVFSLVIQVNKADNGGYSGRLNNLAFAVGSRSELEVYLLQNTGSQNVETILEAFPVE